MNRVPSAEWSNRISLHPRPTQRTPARVHSPREGSKKRMSQSTFRPESPSQCPAFIPPFFPQGGSLSFRDLRGFFGSLQKIHNNSPAAGFIPGGETLGHSLTHDVQFYNSFITINFTQFAFDVNRPAAHPTLPIKIIFSFLRPLLTSAFCRRNK